MSDGNENLRVREWRKNVGSTFNPSYDNRKILVQINSANQEGELICTFLGAFYELDGRQVFQSGDHDITAYRASSLRIPTADELNVYEQGSDG